MRAIDICSKEFKTRWSRSSPAAEIAARSDLKTIQSNVNFGSPQSKLTALRIKTPGQGIQLRGEIDRVDILEKEAAFAVMDYRLYGDSLNLSKVRHGLSLGLLASLAIVQEQSQTLAKKSCRRRRVLSEVVAAVGEGGSSG